MRNGCLMIMGDNNNNDKWIICVCQSHPNAFHQNRTTYVTQMIEI